MPKWKLRPEKSPGAIQPYALRAVLLDGSRSALPPTRYGTSGASAFITAPHAARVATGLAGSNAGSFPARFAGIEPRAAASRAAAFSGFAACQALKSFFQRRFMRWQAAPRSSNVSSTAPGTSKNCAGSKPSAVLRPASSSAPSGAPCTALVSCFVGAPKPMCVFAMMSVGWPVTFSALR